MKQKQISACFHFSTEMIQNIILQFVYIWLYKKIIMCFHLKFYTSQEMELQVISPKWVSILHLLYRTATEMLSNNTYFSLKMSVIEVVVYL